MKEQQIGELCRGTPTISVLDNRGLVVREVQFNRTNIGGKLDTRITRHTYNATGHLHTSIDPRFFSIQQKLGAPASVQANFTYLTGLAGQVLRTDSIDAGSRTALADITGAPHLEWDGDKTLHRFEYDPTLHRLIAVTEKVGDDAPQITERFVYGDKGDKGAAGKNLIGQLVRHYDNAGLQEINSISLTGQPLSETRRLLPLALADSDWQGKGDTVWKELLDHDEYETTWAYNALGVLLTQQDAKDNVQRSEYDIAGNLCGSYLTQSGKNEHCIVSGLEYNARGQKVRELAGNGVASEYTYDEKTSRLNKVATTRRNDPSPLQSLFYTYDPVGNILRIEDKAAATRFYKNQKVSAINAYKYDALYQLTEVFGRENATNNTQNSSLPIPIPIDSNELRNYTRIYFYDRGSNLEKIQHIPSSGTCYSTQMVVSDRSNRAVKQGAQLTISRSDVDSYFDIHGNLNKLEGNKDLVWARGNQLKQVGITGQQQEHYQYTVQGQRIRKTLYDHGSYLKEQVIYLPGLELRRKYNTAKSVDSLKEDLHVLIVGQAGRAQVRLLHWKTGRPTDKNGILDDQLRYSLDNHLGSSNLELNKKAEIISQEEYYPFGGTAVWSTKSDVEANYKTIRYSGKERDATGLYYYGYRYYMPWMGRWLNPDPAWTIDGLNLYRMVKNNPVTLSDKNGLLAQDTKLSQISFFGTHDSATWGMEWMERYSVTQTYSLVNQASMGARYFDIRVKKNWSNRWMFFHGPCHGSSVKRPLKNLLAYAVDNPDKLFIFKFHFHDTTSQMRIGSFLKEQAEAVGAHLISPTKNMKLGEVTIGNSLHQGKNIALLAHHAGAVGDNNASVWNYKENTRGGWAKTSDGDEAAQFLAKNMQAPDDGRILVSQTNLVSLFPMTKNLVKDPGTVRGLAYVANKGHEAVATSIEEQVSKGYNPGVINVDFMGSGSSSRYLSLVNRVNNNNSVTNNTRL